jgi:hypothetical protein
MSLYERCVASGLCALVIINNNACSKEVSVPDEKGQGQPACKRSGRGVKKKANSVDVM